MMSMAEDPLQLPLTVELVLTQFSAVARAPEAGTRQEPGVCALVRAGVLGMLISQQQFGIVPHSFFFLLLNLREN